MNSNQRPFPVGPLTQQVKARPNAQVAQDFPSTQEWANEFELALQMTQKAGVFESFLRRLGDGERGVWGELWAAWFFSKIGFQISQWEPEYVKGRPGDLEINLPNGPPVFVEVKSPDWRGELAQSEREDGRKAQPKYINAEVRSFNNVDPVLHSLDKAQPKLKPGKPNLVTIVDNLFVSPTESIKPFLAMFRSKFAQRSYCKVSGVVFLKPVLIGEKLEYRVFVEPGRGAGLPKQVLEFFHKKVSIW